MSTELDNKITHFFYSNFNILKHSFRANGMSSSSPDAMIDDAGNRFNRGITSHEDDYHYSAKPYMVIEYAMYVHMKSGFSSELEMDGELFETLSNIREFQDHFGVLQGFQVVNGKVGKSEDIPT